MYSAGNYEFTIFDSANDGLSYDGYYRIYGASDTPSGYHGIASNGQYGYYEIASNRRVIPRGSGYKDSEATSFYSEDGSLIAGSESPSSVPSVTPTLTPVPTTTPSPVPSVTPMPTRSYPNYNFYANYNLYANSYANYNFYAN